MGGGGCGGCGGGDDGQKRLVCGVWCVVWWGWWGGGVVPATKDTNCCAFTPFRIELGYLGWGDTA